MRCASPLYIDRNQIPCNKCYGCRWNKQAAWIYRIKKEAEQHCSAFFVTLTYEVQPVKNGIPTLVKSDFQKFMKRLRKINQGQIKYFACGEYGGKTHRPHYHAILMGVDNREKIDKSWSLGMIHIGEVEEASISYTTKYMLKSAETIEGREPNFQLMSKGMGKNYLTENMIKWHKASPTNRVYIALRDGVKIPLPRYYREKIYSEAEWNEISYHRLIDLENSEKYLTYAQWKAQQKEIEREDRARNNKRIKVNDRL